MSLLRLAFVPLLLGACSSGDAVVQAQTADRPFLVEDVARFNEPWAMTFLPDGSALVTERRGRLLLWRRDRTAIAVAGVPAVSYGGQGGLGDVVLHPGFAANRIVYLSFVEAGENGIRGAAVGRGRLTFEGGEARLYGFAVIWRQQPKVEGGGHFSHRIAFGPDGLLYISSGERQKFDPNQKSSTRLSASTTTAALPRAILSPAAAESPTRSGRLATATCSGWPSHPTATSGRSRWGPKAATSST